MGAEFFFALILGLALGAGAVFVFWRRLEGQTVVREKEMASGLKQELELSFKNLAQATLSSSQEQLLNLAKSQLKQESELQRKEVEMLVKPLAESVQNYRKEMSELEAVRNKEYGGLDRLMKTILESNQKLKDETTNLVNALKRPTVRGRWGEIQLRRIVELAGLSKHCDFCEQSTVGDEEARLRPDMIVNLPGSRQIIVDSKATLHAYLEAEEAKDDDARKAALKRHAYSVKTRIQDLSRKSYWDQFKDTPEFVVLFIPGEAFFSAAVEEEPGLIESAFEQKVVLATPTTLMALLRAVAYGWRQEQLTENARKISEEASRLYQNISVWCGHLGELGKSIERVNKHFNHSVGSLERSVMPVARRMAELGVASKTPLKPPVEVEQGPRQLKLEEFKAKEGKA